MKKSLLSFACLLFLLQSFGQPMTKPALTKSDYLLKNKHQKTVGAVLLGGGLTFLLLGAAVGAGDALNGNSSGSSAAEVMGVTGFGAMIASIPVFIRAGKNKRKAAALSVSNQKFFYLQHKDFAIKMQPAVTLKVGL